MTLAAGQTHAIALPASPHLDAPAIHGIDPASVPLPGAAQALAAISVFIVVMHWVDVFWLAAPGPAARTIHFGIADVLCAVGLLSLFAAATLYRLSGTALVPRKDPRLSESMAFENS